MDEETLEEKSGTREEYLKKLRSRAPKDNSVSQCPSANENGIKMETSENSSSLETSYRFKCNFCQKKLRTGFDLHAHIKEHVQNPSLQESSRIFKWECSKCSKDFTTSSALQRHWIHHWDRKDIPFPCPEPECTKAYTTSTGLRAHSKSHIPPIFCKFCLERYLSISELNMHMRKSSETPGSPFSCDLCDMKFCQRIKYEDHKQKFHLLPESHPNIVCLICDKPISRAQRKEHTRLAHPMASSTKRKCKICGKMTGSLESHIRIHTNELPYSCEVCGKRFAQSSNKRTHEKVHRVPKGQFQCSICFHKFFTSGSFENHKLLCGKESEYFVKKESTSPSASPKSSYQCKKCPKATHKKDYIKDHIIRDHLKVKPHLCSICGMRFIQGSELKTHCYTHTDEKPFKCRFCKKEFRQSTHLKTHEKFVHSDLKPISCPHCPYTCKDYWSLKSHLVIHTKELGFTCNICGKSFPRSTPLKRHINLRHNNVREFKCDIEACSKRFPSITELKAHGLSHSEERPFPCTICNRAFKFKDKLVEHFKSKIHKLNETNGKVVKTE